MIIIMLIRAVIILFFPMFLSCSTDTGNSLDIGEYLKLADSNSVYPSAGQIQMLKSFVPEESFQPAPPVTDRVYWDKIAASEFGKEYLDKALSELDKEPEVPITDSIYRIANEQGNRGIYKPRYYRTMERLENFILLQTYGYYCDGTNEANICKCTICNSK